MKYLFFDLENATSKGGIHRICEFGYVITNEKYEIFDRGNLIINPNIDRSEWDYFVVRKILTRKISEYEKQPDFGYYYPDIVNLIKNADYVIGHTLNCDAKAINDECQRYDKPSIDYDFYDVKEIYKEYSNTKKATSVENILNELSIAGDENNHDAETDAYNTMLELKTMVESLGVCFEELVDLCPGAKDKNENYLVNSIKESNIKKELQFMENLCGDGSNDIRKHGYNKNRFIQFLDNVKQTKEGKGKFKDKKISISINYEEHHYKQMLNIVQMIVNEGGQLILKASLSDIFVKYDVTLEDGTVKADSKCNYVNEANDNGANILIIDFDDFLDILEITEEQLDEMPLISFDFLFEDDAIIRIKRDKSFIQKKKNNNNKTGEVYSTSLSSGTTLGELFDDFFKKPSEKEKESK